mgnify:CR=1 FL=1
MTGTKNLIVCVLIASLLAACATSPTGRRQLMLVSEQQAISSSKQAYLSEMKRLDEEGKLSTDIKTNARVREITGRLVAQAIIMRPDTKDWEWSVEVIDEPETVNAWCMAGGRMAIYTGLLEKVQPTDDELAQVMGHEIGHALVAKLIPESDPVYKVTMIPRGRGLGVTVYLPLDERHTYPKSYCMGRSGA